MAIIAVELAQGEGWRVQDLACSAGPRDRPFEELHSAFSVAIVAAGSFQYRAAGGRELMTPGSLLLGNAGETYECSHEHATGDRCISVRYETEYFERLAADGGFSPRFGTARVPALRAVAPLVAKACAQPHELAWDELALELAWKTLRLASAEKPGNSSPPPGALARVTRAVRAVESRRAGTLTDLASEARLSPYHFLRTFQRLTGLTPHQYVMRTRLREAAARLATTREKILDIALNSGFGDLSNFNRAFRTEFGVSPRKFRRSCP